MPRTDYYQGRISSLLGWVSFPAKMDQYKCLFIHIPKTAGVSVSEPLFGQSFDHYTLAWYYGVDYQKSSDYFKFAFVRNPWERLVSAYTFYKRGGFDDEDAQWNSRVLSRFSTFNDFVKGWLQVSSHINSRAHFVPQYHFLRKPNGDFGMDMIGRFENLEEDFKKISDHLGLQRQLPRKNVSSHANRSYVDLYNEESRRIVAALYKTDIELFDYKFGA